jgi:hypothetical protein
MLSVCFRRQGDPWAFWSCKPSEITLTHRVFDFTFPIHHWLPIESLGVVGSKGLLGDPFRFGSPGEAAISREHAQTEQNHPQ